MIFFNFLQITNLFILLHQCSCQMMHKKLSAATTAMKTHVQLLHQPWINTHNIFYAMAVISMATLILTPQSGRKNTVWPIGGVIVPPCG